MKILCCLVKLKKRALAWKLYDKPGGNKQLQPLQQLKPIYLRFKMEQVSQFIFSAQERSQNIQDMKAIMCWWYHLGPEPTWCQIGFSYLIKDLSKSRKTLRKCLFVWNLFMEAEHIWKAAKRPEDFNSSDYTHIIWQDRSWEDLNSTKKWWIVKNMEHLNMRWWLLHMSPLESDKLI